MGWKVFFQPFSWIKANLYCINFYLHYNIGIPRKGNNQNMHNGFCVGNAKHKR